MKQQRPKSGEVANPDSWIGRPGNNPQAGKAMCANSPKLRADRVNDCLKDISFIKKHGDPNRPQYYDGEWIGNPGHRTQPAPPSTPTWAGTRHTQFRSTAESRKDFFARMYGDPDHRGGDLDGWLGNRKIDPSKGLFPPGPRRGRARAGSHQEEGHPRQRGRRGTCDRLRTRRRSSWSASSPSCTRRRSPRLRCRARREARRT